MPTETGSRNGSPSVFKCSITASKIGRSKLGPVLKYSSSVIAGAQIVTLSVARELALARRAGPRHAATVFAAIGHRDRRYGRVVPDVAFKDLCIDVTAGDGRPAAVAKFWSRVLDQEVVAHDDGSFHLAPPPGGSQNRVVWINPVPEQTGGKSRAHIDTRVVDGDPAALLEAGGTLVRPKGDDIEWTVVDDPDGVAVCVFGPHPAAPTALGPFELVVDAADPSAIAAWWAERTGGTVGRRDGAPYVWIENAAGFPFMFWVFQDVPESKTVKNRVHWDVTLVDSTVEGLVAAGASLLRAARRRGQVVGDGGPEGNEFCAFSTSS